MKKLTDKTFKIVWVLSFLFTMYVMFWLVFIEFITQDLFKDDSKDLNWLNFIIPNILCIVLLMLYTKELMIGYNVVNKKRIKRSLAIVLVLSLIVILTLFKYYTLTFQYLDNDLFVIIPIILFFTSIVGLIIHRINKLKHLL